MVKSSTLPYWFNIWSYTNKNIDILELYRIIL